MSKIQGMFPGGPRRQDESPDEGDRTGADLRSGEDVDADATASSIGRRARRKRRSILIGVLVTIVIAGATGGYIGYQAIVTAEELAAQERAKANASGKVSELERIKDDAMRELWEMEAAEAARARAR